MEARFTKWGDTLERMIAKKGFVEPLRTGAFRHFLFSGGGNDIVGGGHLELFLRQFDIAHTDPSDAPWYVNDQFVLALDRVMGLYRDLLRDRAAGVAIHEAARSRLRHALPQRDGPWLGKGMEFRGLHQPTARALPRDHQGHDRRLQRQAAVVRSAVQW